MEQQDSLKMELQNLSRIQLEQVDILRKMSDGNATEKAIQEAKNMSNNVQFNTPAMYANRAPVFQPITAPNYTYTNPFPVGPAELSLTHGMGQGFITNSASLFGADGKFGFLGRANPGTGYSMMSRDLIAMDHSGRIGQAVNSGIGALGSMGATIGASALIGGLPGLIAGMGIGAGVGLWTEKASEEINKNTALKKYLYKNSSRFIDPYESNNDRGISGFSRKEAGDAANFVRTMNDEFYMKDEETMMLLQKYTEGGLLKDSKDLDTFKDKMKSLTKTVKEGALMLNETYDSIADLMAEMRKAGIDQKEFKDLLANGSVLGSLTGENGKDLIQNILNFAQNLNAGTGNSNSATIDRVEHSTVYLNKYYEELKAKSESELTHLEKSNKDMIMNLGGVTEANKFLVATMEKMAESESMTTPALYYFDYNSTTKDFDFNKEKLKKYKSGEITYRQAYEEAQRKLQAYTDEGNGEALIKWQNNASNYIKRNLRGEDLSDALFASIQMLAQDPSMKAQGFDARSIMGSYFGVKDGDVQNLLSGFWENEAKNPGLMKQFYIQSAWQQETSSALAKAPSFTELVSSGFEKFTDWATSGLTWLNEGIGNLMVGTWDKITGVDRRIPTRFDKEFSTKSDLESVSFENVLAETKNTNDILATGFASLSKLSEKGYGIDSGLMGFLEDKFNSSDKIVDYSRDIISDWNEVAQDLKENKDTITDQAKKASLSETIVAALHKYNSSKPDDEKIDVSKTVETLGKDNFDYGGNTALALASTFSNKDSIDIELKRLGYNVDALRSAGAQEVFKNIKLDDLGSLRDEVKTKVNEILNTNIGVNGGQITQTGQTVAVQGGTTPTSQSDLIHMDLRNKSSITAEQLDQFIESRTRNKPDSLLRGKGQLIYDTAYELGVDPLFALAQMANESAWGTSNITKNKMNFSGWGANDSNPYALAHSYSSVDEGIRNAIQNTAKHYIYGEEEQNTLYKFNRSKSGTHNYTGNNDPTHYENALSSIMMEAVREFGLTYGGVQVTKDGEVVYSNSGVRTEKESVIKDSQGNNVGLDLKVKSKKKHQELLGNDKSDHLNKFRQSLLDNEEHLKILSGPEHYGYGSTKTKNTSKNESAMILASQLKGFDIGNGGSAKLDTADDVLRYINNFYNTNRKMIKDFASGKGSSEWESKSTAEKSQINEILKIIEQNYKPKGAGKGIEKEILDGDGRKIYTEKELENLEIINRTGNVDLSTSNKNSGSKNHVAFLNKNENKVLTDEKIENDIEKYLSYSPDRIKTNSDDPVVQKQDKFINSANKLHETYSELSSKGPDIATRKREAVDFIYSSNSSGELKNKKEATSVARNMDYYMGLLDTVMSSGEYEDVESALKENKQLSAARQKVASGFKDNGKKLKQFENSNYGINVKTAFESDILDVFAREYLGLNKKDYMGNISEYNMLALDKATQFYNNKMSGLHQFIYSDKNGKQAKEWAELSLTEKANTLEMMNALGGVLGKDKDDKINTVGEIKYNLSKKKNKTLEETALTEEERGFLKHLKKQDDGSFIYDSTYSADNEENAKDRKRTIENYNSWRRSGEKVDTNSAMKSKLSELTGKDVAINSNATIEELKNLLNLETDKVIAKNKVDVANVLKEANKITKGEIEGLNSLDQATKNEFVNALKSGNVDYISKFNENNPNAKIDENLIKTYEKLAESINGVDLNGFQSLVDLMDRISNISADTGNTAVLLQSALDDTTKKEYETKALTNAAAVFGQDSAVGKAILEGGKGTIKELADVLINGGVGKVAGQEVKLSANDIQTLAAAMADAIDDTMKTVTTNNEKLSKFIESQVYKTAKQQSEESGKKIYVNEKNESGENVKVAKSLEETEKILSGLNTQIEKGEKSKEDVSGLIKERDEIATQFTKTVQESLQEVTSTADEGLAESQKTVDDAVKTAGDNAKTFADTIAKYDSSIGSAITTMNNRIGKLEKSVVQPSGIKGLLFGALGMMGG